MKHFLLTRFNLGFKEFFKHQDIDATKWLQFRIDFFFKYTYPLIINQDSNDFKWIVVFDSKTNNEFLNDFINKDSQKKVNILTSSQFSFISDLQEYIKKSTSKGDIIITTRIDSDDGFFPDSLSKIRQLAKLNLNNVPFGINLSKGVIVDVKNGIFYKKKFISNPFISLVECQNNVLTVYSEEHLNIGKKYKVINESKKVYWLQLVHSGNLLNQLKGIPVLFYPKRIKTCSYLFNQSYISKRMFFFLKVIFYKILLRLK